MNQNQSQKSDFEILTIILKGRNKIHKLCAGQHCWVKKKKKAAVAYSLSRLREKAGVLMEQLYHF